MSSPVAPLPAWKVAAEITRCRPSDIDGACFEHNMPGNWGRRGTWRECSVLARATAIIAADREATRAVLGATKSELNEQGFIEKDDE